MSGSAKSPGGATTTSQQYGASVAEQFVTRLRTESVDPRERRVQAHAVAASLDCCVLVA